jgi:alanine racemase
MNYSLSHISQIIDGTIIGAINEDILVSHIVYDTRKISHNKSSLFVALKGAKNDGHRYIPDAISKGIKAFIVDEDISKYYQENIQFIKVNDSLRALQKLASYHRSQFQFPVVGITGSNGKTTVKEWLYQTLNQDFRIMQSPQSYNSQLGVALSVLMIESHHEMALIEAGISRKNEMQHLQNMIMPSIGIFTNIGDAHSSGFNNIDEKIHEKMKLFTNSQVLIYNKDDKSLDPIINTYDIPTLITWGENSASTILITEKKRISRSTELSLSYKKKNYQFTLPFVQDDLVENCMSMISYLLYLDWDIEKIQSALSSLRSLKNRLEIKAGKNNCILINDSYSLDLASLRLALEYQEQHATGKHKLLIVTPLMDQKTDPNIYNQITNLIKEKNQHQVIGIGYNPEQKKLLELSNIIHYDTAEQCLIDHPFHTLSDNCILIKGARSYQLEKINNQLSEKVHQTILETDYDAVAHNLKVFRSFVPNETMLMAIIKAEAYGSGSVPMAHYLSRQGVNYLGVALMDEAIKIRESGIDLPIMIFNVQENNLELLWQYNIEPEIYSFRLLEQLITTSASQKSILGIHIKVDTGMHRLGFQDDEIDRLTRMLNDAPQIKVLSIFSHLSASEDEKYDAFTKQQIATFDSMYSQIIKSIEYKPLRHILNTGGIIRHSENAYEMVRLGIGLYGINSSKNTPIELQKSHALSTTILQIKKLKKGETTGYSRSGIATEDMTIAVIGIGYADGFLRSAGNGRFSVYINGQECPTIGNICMDVSIIDITPHTSIQERDKVTIFDSLRPVEKLAEACNTIPYEILSRISLRVKRTYIYN